MALTMKGRLPGHANINGHWLLDDQRKRSLAPTYGCVLRYDHRACIHDPKGCGRRAAFLSVEDDRHETRQVASTVRDNGAETHLLSLTHVL